MNGADFITCFKQMELISIVLDENAVHRFVDDLCQDIGGDFGCAPIVGQNCRASLFHPSWTKTPCIAPMSLDKMMGRPWEGGVRWTSFPSITPDQNAVHHRGYVGRNQRVSNLSDWSKTVHQSVARVYRSVHAVHHSVHSVYQSVQTVHHCPKEGPRGFRQRGF